MSADELAERIARLMGDIRAPLRSGLSIGAAEAHLAEARDLLNRERPA